jgi:hypothetical protein
MTSLIGIFVDADARAAAEMARACSTSTAAGNSTQLEVKASVTAADSTNETRTSPPRCPRERSTIRIKIRMIQQAAAERARTKMSFL